MTCQSRKYHPDSKNLHLWPCSITRTLLSRVNRNSLKLHFLVAVVVSSCALLVSDSNSVTAIESWQPNIPKTWVDSKIAELEVPLASPARRHDRHTQR